MSLRCGSRSWAVRCTETLKQHFPPVATCKQSSSKARSYCFSYCFTLLPEMPFPQLQRRDLWRDVNGSALQGFSQKPFEEALQSVPRDFQPQVFPCYLSQQWLCSYFCLAFPVVAQIRTPFSSAWQLWSASTLRWDPGGRCRTLCYKGAYSYLHADVGVCTAYCNTYSVSTQKYWCSCRYIRER